MGIDENNNMFHRIISQFIALFLFRVFAQPEMSIAFQNFGAEHLEDEGKVTFSTKKTSKNE